jgi:hypothetical protein
MRPRYPLTNETQNQFGVVVWPLKLKDKEDVLQLYSRAEDLGG